MIWKHKKTGHLYTVVGFSIIETGMVPAVIYRRSDSVFSTAFVRPCAEFFDGRFEQQPLFAKSRAEKPTDENE